jgi:hydrogenase maturation protease
MGNSERGDDGFGSYIASSLVSLKTIKTIDCGRYIENYLNTIVNMAPDLIILFDTVKHGASDTLLLKNEEIVRDHALSISTHNLPFSAVYEYLKHECRADIWLFGVTARSYETFSNYVKTIAQKVICAMEFLDSQSKINIINVYETLSSTLR